MSRFVDRVTFITGGAKGIGLGCVRMFLEAGGLVAAFDRDTDAIRDLQDSVDDPDRLIVYRGDVTNSDWLTETIEETVTRFGRLDCLVNNAGIHPPALSIEQTDPELCREVMTVNFHSTFVASRAAAPHLCETSGSIVNISSMTGILGQRHSTAYSASKAAQIGFTKSLAIELGERGVRVNAILPSNIDTPLMREWAATLPDSEAAMDQVARLQVLGRMGTADEIGRIAVFLASDDASFLTGQAIEADGGAALDY